MNQVSSNAREKRKTRHSPCLSCHGESVLLLVPLFPTNRCRTTNGIGWKKTIPLGTLLPPSVIIFPALQYKSIRCKKLRPVSKPVRCHNKKGRPVPSRRVFGGGGGWWVVVMCGCGCVSSRLNIHRDLASQGQPQEQPTITRRPYIPPPPMHPQSARTLKGLEVSEVASSHQHSVPLPIPGQQQQHPPPADHLPSQHRPPQQDMVRTVLSCPVVCFVCFCAVLCVVARSLSSFHRLTLYCTTVL
jgi:hypothetical protein